MSTTSNAAGQPSDVPLEQASQPATHNRKGKGSKQKQELKFRMKKNQSTQDQLRQSLMLRLKISDPTEIGTIKLKSAVVPSRVPVVFKGIPAVIDETWDRMKAVGTRPFQTLATSANRSIFFKVILLILEAKVCFAQRKIERARFNLPTSFAFDEMILRKILSVSKCLPLPIAIAVEALGNFSVQSQPFVPVFPVLNPPVTTGAVTLARTDLKALVQALREPVAADNMVVAVAREIEGLPNLAWEQLPDNLVCLTPASVEFWGSDDLLPAHERQIFLQIIASMESKKGFLVHVDLEHGDGSGVPAVRFHENYQLDETETLYYLNAEISEYDERLAPALMYGYEYGIPTFSRLCGSWEEPLKQGSACQHEARRALIWSVRSD